MIIPELEEEYVFVEHTRSGKAPRPPRGGQKSTDATNCNEDGHGFSSGEAQRSRLKMRQLCIIALVKLKCTRELREKSLDVSEQDEEICLVVMEQEGVDPCGQY